MKRSIYITLFILPLLLCTHCRNKESTSAIIGIDLPLTGKYDYWGNEFMAGAKIFSDQHPEIKVKFEDNHSNIDVALTNANNLIELSNVNALVSLFVPFSSSLRDVAESAKVPFVTSFISASDFTKGYNFYFNDFATHDMQLPLLVDCVTDSLNLSRGVYYCVDDDYGTDGAKVISRLMGEKGIPISGEIFSSGTSNHRNALTKLMNGKVDFVFLIARNNDLITAVNQIRERDKNVLILGAGAFDAPEIWAGIPSENQEHILFASSYFEKDYNEEAKEFYEAFYKLRGRGPNYPAVFGYTICQYLSDGLVKSKEKGISLVNYLEDLDYDSIRGKVKMTNNHIVYSSIAIYKRVDGQSIPIATEMEMPDRE